MGLESSFFRASLKPASAVDPFAEVWAALDHAALPVDEITERARISGLSSAGGSLETLRRLAWLQEYAQRGNSGGGGAAAPPAFPASAAASVVAALLGRDPGPGAVPQRGAEPEAAPSEPPSAEAAMSTLVKEVAGHRKRRRRITDAAATSAWAAVDLEEEERQRVERRRLEEEQGGGDGSSGDEDVDGVPLAPADVLPLAVVADPAVSQVNTAFVADNVVEAPAVALVSSGVGIEDDHHSSASDSEDVDGVPLY